MKPIPYGRQCIDAADVAAVTEALNSDWLTQGPAVERFEQAVAAYCGAKYAVAVNSATSALHIACLAAGVGRGDVVWTTPNTFVASANCALYCGADVDFVDIDAATYNMSEAELADKLARARKGGRLPKAVVPVDFSGQSCAMERIAALAQDFGFTVIEDASHAIGATYRGGKVGACRYAAMTVFSFHAVKIITSGEGGMITTNSRELYERLVLLRSHGITRDAAKMAGESHGAWYYQQIGLGYNYRMTDIQAALGASQLAKIDGFVARRRELAARYDRLLGGLPLTLPWQAEKDASAWHLYVVRLKLDEIAKSHRRVFEELRSAGIGVNLHYIPVHTQPYYQGLGFKAGDFPAAERYYAEAVSLPMHCGLSDEQQDYVAATLAKVLA